MTRIISVTATCEFCEREVEIVIPDMANPAEYADRQLKSMGWQTEPRDLCPDCSKIRETLRKIPCKIEIYIDRT